MFFSLSFFFCHSCFGSLEFGTFGFVRVWVRCHSYFSMICCSLPLSLFCDFCVCVCVRICVCVCDFEKENKKSEIFVFVFGVLVATLVWLKNMILEFLFLGFWSRLMNIILRYGFCLGFWSRFVEVQGFRQFFFFFLLGHRLGPEMAWARWGLTGRVWALKKNPVY